MVRVSVPAPGKGMRTIEATGTLDPYSSGVSGPNEELCWVIEGRINRWQDDRLLNYRAVRMP